jgi:hypothetical protein
LWRGLGAVTDVGRAEPALPSRGVVNVVVKRIGQR